MGILTEISSNFSNSTVFSLTPSPTTTTDCPWSQPSTEPSSPYSPYGILTHKFSFYSWKNSHDSYHTSGWNIFITLLQYFCSGEFPVVNVSPVANVSQVANVSPVVNVSPVANVSQVANLSQVAKSPVKKKKYKIRMISPIKMVLGIMNFQIWSSWRVLLKE